MNPQTSSAARAHHPSTPHVCVSFDGFCVNGARR